MKASGASLSFWASGFAVGATAVFFASLSLLLVIGAPPDSGAQAAIIGNARDIRVFGVDRKCAHIH